MTYRKGVLVEQIRAKTENGSMYILTTDSETDESYLWGDCLKVQNDGTYRSFGTIALLNESLEIGKSMAMVVPSERGGAENYDTTAVTDITRQEIAEEDLAVIQSFRELGKLRGYSPDLLEEFVDEALAFTRDFMQSRTEDSAV